MISGREPSTDTSRSRLAPLMTRRLYATTLHRSSAFSSTRRWTGRLGASRLRPLPDIRAEHEAAEARTDAGDIDPHARQSGHAGRQGAQSRQLRARNGPPGQEAVGDRWVAHPAVDHQGKPELGVGCVGCLEVPRPPAKTSSWEELEGGGA